MAMESFKRIADKASELCAMCGIHELPLEKAVLPPSKARKIDSGTRGAAVLPAPTAKPSLADRGSKHSGPQQTGSGPRQTSIQNFFAPVTITQQVNGSVEAPVPQ